MPGLTITIDPASLKKLLRRLGAARSREVLRGPMERGVAVLQRDLADYPAPSRAPQPAKSRRQQIKQIMLGKEGKIPYRRTGTLGRAWTTDVDEEGGGLSGTVGNRTQYGPLVESAVDQVRYHRGVWQTDEEVLRANQRGIFDDFADAIEDALHHG